MEIVRVGSVASTQEVARALPIGTAVMAEHQEAGRGRLGRRWEAPPGTALLASFVMPFQALAPIAAGVAAAAACGPAVRLKWPNDLLLEDRKLGGILVEAAGDRAIVGIGINLAWAPPRAARLDAEREGLLERLVAALQQWWVAPPDRLLDAWRERSDTLGRRVRVELAGEVFEGQAEDIADDGALIVGGRRVAAGDVTHLRVVGAKPTLS
jgi:BirA family biotin operon repressor/biotin-[acetyl-CoA-carboxylase] ligase